jgi:succinate-semialdehyde dehydrogenase/glutarate-semialdehyde dehydrogenase
MTEFLNKLYIGGEWREASNGAHFNVLNPANETVLTSVASGTVEDALACVDAADAAFAAWASNPPRERSEILRKAFEIFTERLSAIARLITLENGTDAMGKAKYAAEFFRWHSEEAVRSDGYLGMAPATGARTAVHQKPTSIALLITPWNYPAAMGTRKIAPALAAGCPVMIKPTSETPLTMLVLIPILEEAGLPPGVVNILPSRSSGEVVAAILADRPMRVVSFTGFTDMGRKILHAAADNIVKPAMELGGNAPFIVCQDADVEAAAQGRMLAKMRNLGEACTAANRIYVHEDVEVPFVESSIQKMAALKMGNGLLPGIDVGPLVNAETRDKVAHFVDDAVEKGAKVKLGGARPNGPGFYYPPTVLTQVPDSTACLSDEIFGPVTAIQTFTNEDEVVARANNTEFGLVAYFHTKDMRRDLGLSERLDFGMIGLNRGLVSNPAAPFGGTKQFDLGREGGKEGMLEFQETHYISTEW